MLGGIFEKNDISSKLNLLDKKISEEKFWQDKLSAQKVVKKKVFLQDILDSYNNVRSELKSLEELLDLAIKQWKLVQMP